MRTPALEIIQAATRLMPVPLVPQIRLHLAGEPIEVWEHTERALGDTEQPPPFWAFAWPGGQALARYLLDHPAAVRGLRVLDLASGSGLVAIAAARAGAAQVTANDVDPLAVVAIAVNAAANGVTVAGRSDDLLSGDLLGKDLVAGDPVGGDLVGDSPLGGDGGRWPAADVVLVADAFYEKDLAVRVMAFVERARGHGARVLLADPGRAYLPRAGLTALASYEVPGVGALEDADSKRTTIWVPSWQVGTAGSPDSGQVQG
jgi:predicted nicotinamide N-methyase